MYSFKKIRTKFTITNVFIAFLVTIVIGTVNYATTSQKILQYQERELRATVESLTNFSIYFLSNTKNRLEHIANSAAIEKYNTSFNEEALLQYFSRNVGQFKILSFVSEQRQEEIKIVQGQPNDDYDDISNITVYRKATQKPNIVQIGSPRYSELLQAPILDFGYQRVSYFKENLGFIRATILLSQFAEQLKSNQLPTLTFISDAMGNLVYAPKTDLLTTSLTTRSDTSTTLFESTDKKTIVGEYTILNQVCFVVTTTIPEVDWHIVVAIPIDEFLSPLHQLRNTIVFVAILVMALTLVIAYFLGKSITEPIIEIKDAAIKIGAGDLNTKIEMTSQDEIGELASAFNSMTEDLLRSNYELKSTQAQLIQSGKLASLGELATGIAHEINQPLTYISTKVQTLQLSIEKERVDMTQVLTTLKAFKGRIKRISSIIMHLRSLGRNQEMEFVSVKLNDVLNNTLLLLAERMKLKNIQWHQNLETGLPSLKGHPYQLEQIFINILQNAIDALAPQQGGIIRFQAVQCPQQQTIEIKISDNGPGISVDILKRIFDPFYTTKSEGQGTGLGLSISHSIIQAHHGKIICQSQPDQGTAFIITLPIEKRL